MRSHAKAPTAGSTKRLGKKSKPALLLCVLAASVAVLALVVGSASGATTRFLVEAFGSSDQPTFPADRGMAYDQGAGELYVIDSTENELHRFNADGTSSSFSALGSNAIDGEGSGDETPEGSLSFSSNRQREQVAIDESGTATDGNLYLTQSGSDVIDIFNPEGEYLGQLTESTEGGAFGEPCGVAVDDEGTVYVGDRGDDRIHVFDPAAAVPVNGDSAATSFATLTDPCTLAAGMGATDGFLFAATSTGAALSKLDAATGEVKYAIATGASTVSVDPATGHVFLARNTGGSSSVDEYDASGAAEAALVSSFKPGSTVEGIALNSGAEQVYVARSGTEEVEVFGPAAVVPDVVTEAPSSNTGTRATLAGTVNPDGVELDECFFEWTQSDSGSAPASYDNTVPCAQTPAEIGAGTSPVAVSAEISGLKPQGVQYHYRIVAKNPSTPAVNGSNQNFSTPNTVVTQAATGVTPTEATLNGTVNPDTATISECVFEWGEEKSPLEPVQAYPEAAPCIPGLGGITGESAIAVEADISGLHPGTTYVYRLRADYPSGPITGAVKTVQSGGAVINDVWTDDVLYTEAILKAQINPEGAATTYHLEYGTDTSYGFSTEVKGVGSDSEAHLVSESIDGLSTNTTYHYRFVATSSVGTTVGRDHVFKTYAPVEGTSCSNQGFRYGFSAKLPDCRAYEMVSPVEKNGADIVTACNINCRSSGLYQSSVSGDKITYSSYKAFDDAKSAPYTSQYMAVRGSGGWSTDAISPPRGAKLLGPGLSLESEFKAFTPDLATGMLRHDSDPPLDPIAPEGFAHLYSRDSMSGAYEALTADDPDISTVTFRPEFQGMSGDGKEVVIATSGSLTPGAPTSYSVYLNAEGGLHLVSVMPNGEPSTAAAEAGSGGASEDNRQANVRNAISADGSRIFWTTVSNDRIYVRENPSEEQSALSGEDCTEPAKACTRPISELVSGDKATYLTATTDGSAVLFRFESGSLYSLDVDTETPTKVADNVSGVLGASDDFGRIYFVSPEVLAAGATDGEENLYLREGGTVTFIATLSSIDVGLVRSNAVSVNPIERANRITPNGRHIAFMSNRSLTGYDNTDAETGEPNAQVYTYSADTGALTCASCNPGGARSHGQFLNQPYSVQSKPLTLHAAAWIPTWERQLYGSRVLSDDGSRLFFNSYDALVPQDTNGKIDVYQWEAVGSGTCGQAPGCVDLVSTGESSAKSEFLDASSDGRDVFFRTESSISPEDPGLIDIYNARAGGGFPAPESLQTECNGDACQDVPEPPPIASPASAAYRGPQGQSAGSPSCRAVGRRAQKLSRRAKRLRRNVRRIDNRRQVRRLGRKARRLAQRASRLSRNAKRCRRVNRRATR